MNYKELAEKAREIKADGERFLAQYENEIVDFLREDAEERGEPPAEGDLF